MENVHSNFNEQQSLLVIQQMITAAKRAIKEDGFMYLLWGWLVFAAGALNYILAFVVHYEHPYLPWPVLMLSGAVISVIYGKRQQKKQKVKTYVYEFMAYLWGAFLFALLFVLLYMIKIGPELAYPLILVVYGIGTFVSGGVLRYKPLIFGGIGCWILAIAAAFVSFDIQLLLLLAAILIGFIIPGHLLRAKYNHEKAG
ncbi:MAG: hypothetical protein LPK19_17210 [Hymenobacteraceae bacterium]|nr:hypothetical protein [Hymenobacteraceae bacterium]MDX5397993.1 hypothetical protein [Hymenobacteraceae bacterium]MDX5514065.1 hypothetical protein [Hymenobacteraceae bacterium]